jgi:hypothetical protein
MIAAGDGTADPVEHGSLCLTHCRRRQILESDLRQESGESGGDAQANGGGTVTNNIGSAALSPLTCARKLAVLRIGCA